MRAEELFDILGDTDGRMVCEAIMPCPVKRRTFINVLAAAACLALIIGAAMIFGMASDMPSVSDAGGALDGIFPEGVDPLISSVAVYPEYEKVQDVEDAVIIELSREQAFAERGMSEHLPKILPAGFGFERAELYRTVMKNGTVYRMMRVHYTNAPMPEAVVFTEADGSEAAYMPAGTEFPSQINLSIFDFEPRTDNILLPEQVNEAIAEKSGYFCVSYGSFYVGIEPLDHDGDFTDEDIIKLVGSIE